MKRMSSCASSTNSRIPRIALTPGEPAGIGPDIVLAIAERACNASLVCIGDPGMLAARAAQLGRRVAIRPYEPLQTPAPHVPGGLPVIPVPVSVPVSPGVLDAANGRYVLDCLDRAVAGCISGEFSALVTGPVHKGVINQAGIPFTGHTEYLATRVGNCKPVMVLVAGTLRVALVTTHLPLRAVSDSIDRSEVAYVIETVAKALTGRFGIAAPRIAVCGLNPHAGEGGYLGREDDSIIAPAIADCAGRGLRVRGPLPADTAFTPKALASADAIVAMYHDQGLPALKALGFGHAVNMTLGLPFIRTSVDHGTALEIAGSGAADPGSLAAALQLAIEFVQAGRNA